MTIVVSLCKHGGFLRGFSVEHKKDFSSHFTMHFPRVESIIRAFANGSASCLDFVFVITRQFFLCHSRIDLEAMTCFRHSLCKFLESTFEKELAFSPTCFSLW